MKGKIFALILSALLVVAFLFGCKPSDTDQNQGGAGGGNTDVNLPSADEVIYSAEAPLNIVIGSGFKHALAYDLQEAVYGETDVISNLYPEPPEEELQHAVYLGRVDNELSKRAYEKLEDIIDSAELDAGYSKTYVGYVFYVKGTSVAIAYSDDMYDSTMEVALESFLNGYVKGKPYLSMKNGVASSECYAFIDFLEEVDEAYYERAWSTLLEKCGNPELVEALKKLKTLYNNKTVSWLANLYDEEIGGFYYSNSGRDNHGFLPDVDSTYQALTLISHMGMQSDFGYGRGSYPKGFTQQIGIFAKSLQDENGFFYHPQWTKEMVDSKLSRRARDLIRAQALISQAGMKPTYNTPDGGKGDGLIWDKELGAFVPLENLTEPLGESVASAVSKVTSTAAYVPDHMRTEEALRVYLQAFLNANKNFYTVNNELANQTSQFLERDRQLAREGASWRCVPIIIDFLNEHQNPENGSWSSITNYNAVDGLFKAAHVYTAFGCQIPNAMAAAMTALNAITSEQATTHICNIYNCWCTLDMVMDNMKQFGAADDAKTVLEAVRKVAAPSIEATLVKYLEFQKEDKSFSYYKDRCSAESQGMQVAIQCNEGDMNATSLCYSVWNTVFNCIGYTQYEIPLHGSADFANFVEMIDGIGGVIKDPMPAPEVITFDDDKAGSVSNEVTYQLTSPGAYAMLADDPRPGVEGNVLELASNPGGGDVVMVGVDKLSLGSCFIFEGEFCVADAKKDYVMQINLGPSGYMLNVRLVDAKDEKGEPYKKVQILEASSQGSPRIERDLGISSRLGEWFKIRFEYYVGSHDSVRIKVYFNDTLAAVTDNYYDHKGEKITTGTGSPQRYYTYTQINVMSSQTATILMDNLFAAKTDDRYTPEHDLNDQPLINCDPPVRDEVIYDFEDLEVGKNYPEDFTVTENGGSVEVVTADGGNRLNIKALGSKNEPAIYLPAVTRGPKTNCAVAEMVVTANSGNVGSALNIRFRANDPISGDKGAITAFNLEIVEKGGEKYIAVTEAPNGKTVSYIENAEVKVGESFKLRLEHYEDANVTLVYVDENLVASSDLLTTGGGSRSFGRLEISALTESTVDISIDDLKAERIAKSFTEATKPAVDEKLYDFENGALDAATDGDIVDVTKGKALRIMGAGKRLTLPMNVRAVITNFYRLSMDTTFGGLSESTYRVAFLGETGKYVLAFELISVGGEVFIYEYTENGRCAKPIASFKTTSDTYFAFEYYPGSGVCQITYGKNCIAVTSVTYSSASADIAVAKCEITALDGVGSLTVDNCICESYNALYTAKTPIGENTEDGAEKLTFDSSSTGNLPSAVTYKLVSLGAAVRIEELLGKQDTATKALIFDSTADAGGDEVAFKVTDPAEGEWNALVFEADLAFRAENLGRISYQIFFEGATDSNNTRQYLTSLTYGSGKLKLKDYSYGSSSTAVTVDDQEAKLYRNDGPNVTLSEPVNATDWFTLRIEIYKGERNDMRILTYVNDSLVFVTNNFYRSHEITDPNDLGKVSQVRILALTDCEATAIVDNVSLAQVAKELPTDTGSATVKLYPTTNKPVIVIPEVPDDTDIPEKIPYDTDRIYTNTKVEDKNGTEQPTLVVKDGRLHFISDGGDYIYITPTVKKGSYNHASFEADLTFTFNTAATSGNQAFYTFSASDEDKKTSFRFNIEYNIAAGEIKFVAYNTGKTYASTVMKKVIGTPGVPTQESVSFNYRLEYFFIGSDVVILNYFDNELVYAVNSRENQSYVTSAGVRVDYNLYYNYNATTPTNPYSTLGRVEINSHSGTKTDMSIDNLRFVQDDKTLDESLVTPKPGTLIRGETGTGVYYKSNGGYEYNITNIWKEADLNNPESTGNPFIWRSSGGSNDRRYITADGKASAGEKYGYIQIASQGSNKTLEYGQATSDDRNSRLYLKSENSVGNLYVFETDLVIGSVSGVSAGDELLSFLFGTGHSEQSSFFGALKVIKTADGYALGSSVDKTYAPLDVSTWYNIAVEYYHEEGIVRYYVNGTRVASERLVTAKTVGKYAYASVALCANAYDAFIRLDNTVASAYDKAFAPIDGEVDSLATVLPVKGGANGTLVLIHDDGDLDTMARLDRIYGQHSLKADVAMVVNRVYDVTSGSVKSSAAQWQTYLDKGWGVINHSFTHTFWGEATEEGITVDEAKLIEEIVNSKTYLQAAFPSERILTFAYPGFSAITDTLGYGKAKTYAAALELIKTNYISGREYNFTTSTHNTINFYDVNYSFLPASSISLGEANLKRTLERIDGATLGGITVLFSHRVCADGEEKSTDTSTVPESYVKAIAEKAGNYVKEGMLWSANYEDAVLYHREAQAATVKTVSTSDSITVTLTDTLDDAIYNYALTVEVIVPTSWAGVKVVQGGNTSYAKAFERDGKWIVYVDIVPDAGDAVLTPESENLPSIPTLPCDHEDADGDGYCDKCTREYHDQSTCVHKDADGNGECDKCEIGYYDPATCPHVDRDVNRLCDKCGTTYYDPSSCKHIDTNLDAKCDYCGSTYYTESTCPGHTDTNGNTVCDTCGCRYADPTTCRHKDADGDSKCDKCEITYHDPSTCKHVDEDEDEICDKCKLNLDEAPTLGGEGSDDQGWLN